MEIWKDIKGYEGYYQVSNYGNVKSLDRTVFYKNRRVVKYKGKLLKTICNKYGYLYLRISKNNFIKHKYVSRLVAEAFIKKPFNKNTVNHIDGNKTNNHASNLEWCTQKENIQHAWNVGLCESVRTSKNKNKPQKPVVMYKGEQEFLIFDSMTEAARAMGNIGFLCGISNCCNGKGKLSNGYQWKYASVQV